MGIPTTLGSHGVSSSTTCTITTTAAIVAGNLVIVAISTGGHTVSGVTDGTNTYTHAFSAADADVNTEIWYKQNAAAVGSGASLIVTVSGSDVQAITAAQVSGVLASSSYDSSTGHGASALAGVSTGTLSKAQEIIFGATGRQGPVGSLTDTAPFTNLVGFTANSWGITLSYAIRNSTASVTYHPSGGGSDTDDEQIIVGFKLVTLASGFNMPMLGM
jgi:hypothetical protein